MRRPRGGEALLTDRAPQQEPLPQAWVPRVVNLAVAVVFLLLLAPVFGAWSGKPWYVQAAILMFGLPFALVALMALSSAARPGSVARGFRRLRRR